MATVAVSRVAALECSQRAQARGRKTKQA